MTTQMWLWAVCFIASLDGFAWLLWGRTGLIVGALTALAVTSAIRFFYGLEAAASKDYDREVAKYEWLRNQVNGQLRDQATKEENPSSLPETSNSYWASEIRSVPTAPPLLRAGRSETRYGRAETDEELEREMARTNRDGLPLPIAVVKARQEVADYFSRSPSYRERLRNIALAHTGSLCPVQELARYENVDPQDLQQAFAHLRLESLDPALSTPGTWEHEADQQSVPPEFSPVFSFKTPS